MANYNGRLLSLAGHCSSLAAEKCVGRFASTGGRRWRGQAAAAAAAKGLESVASGRQQVACFEWAVFVASTKHLLEPPTMTGSSTTAGASV